MYRWQVIHQCLVSESKVGFLHIANPSSDARARKKAAMERLFSRLKSLPRKKNLTRLKKMVPNFIAVCKATLRRFRWWNLTKKFNNNICLVGGRYFGLEL